MLNLIRICALLTICFLCTNLMAKGDSKIRLGPQPLRAGDHGVGRLAPDPSFTDLSGKRWQLSQLSQDRVATVIAMTSTSCPISQKYFPTLVNLAKTYTAQGIKFLIVNPKSTDDLKLMQKAQETLGNNATYVFDQQGSLAETLGADTTADVIVINSSRTVVFHGAVDDQYGFGYSLEAPRKNYLIDALDAFLEKRTPTVEATAAPGCKLSLNTKQPSLTNITYHARISRLMQRHCVECHREGGVGPFALDTFDDVISHAPMIREVVNRGIMPPWFAVEPKESAHSLWANDRSMTTVETKELIAWIEGDQTEGDPANAPKPLKFSTDWQIGKPDAEFAFAKPVPIKATGVIPYKHVTIQTNLDEDKWIQGIEIRPGDPAAVHHALVFVMPPEGKSKKYSKPDGINYWAIYVPGSGTQVYPEAYARRLPMGSRLVFQMHYTTNGTATEDRTRIGFKYADKPPIHEVKTGSIVNPRFIIPAGAGNHQVQAELNLPYDIQILGYLPHHHLRGKASRYELLSEENKPELLLDVPHYDFNWQLFYQYAKPRIFPANSTLRFTAWYDNSPENPANPDPTQPVRWGQQTYEEMHLGYIEYTVPGDKLGEVSRKPLISGGGRRRQYSFESFDENSDGEISKDEIKKIIPNLSDQKSNGIFLLFDSNGSGSLNEGEFNNLRKQMKRR